MAITTTQGLGSVLGWNVSVLHLLRLQPYPAKSPPGRLRTAALVMVLFGLASWVCLHSAQKQMSAVAQTVGHDAVPSIKASQELAAEIIRMTSTSAGLLLAQGTPLESLARIELETERGAANDMQIRANENVTYGPITFGGHFYPAERDSVVRIEHGLQDFLVFNGLAQNQGVAGASQLWDATLAVQSSLLKPVEDLAGNNYAHLDRDYLKFSPLQMIALNVASVLALCGMFYPLLKVQAETGSFSGRATLGVFVMLAFVSASALSLRNDSERLRVAKQDAFDSINVLSKADMLAAGLEANTALWMMLPQHREQAAKAISDATRDVSAPADGSYKGGFLTQAVANVTFKGEDVALRATQSTWMDMVSSSAKIRNLEAGNHHEQAVKQLIEPRPDSFSATYARFHEALANAVAINHQWFVASVSGIDTSLLWITWGSPLVFLFGLGMVWSGVTSREYLYA